jgi:pyrroloquinoline quinone biosynthesis protein D
MREVTMSARPRLSARARLQWDPVRQKQVLLAPEGVLVLNTTASALLALCDGQHNVAEIAAELCTQYNHVVEQEILTFLNRLAGKRLLEGNDEE